VHGERLKIDTPEQITLELPVAGIGSRFLALAVDTVLQVTLYAAGTIALAFGPRVIAAGAPAMLRMMGPALAIVFAFCVYWGYFAFFEILWSGRTPGKRMAGIRVIKESGRPINAYEAIARNVLRAIDFLPLMYGAGVFVMMLNRHSRRIGDYVAGTVVVHDTLGEDFRPDWHDGAGGARPDAGLERMTRMTAEELALIETYLRRRADLDPNVRQQMASEMAARITKQTGAVPDPDQSLDEFIEGVARRVRDSARFR
jgi:uncharacterized RDD family membrane protein YckC